MRVIKLVEEMMAKLLNATTFWLFWCTLIGIIGSFILHGRLDLKYLALWIIGGTLISDHPLIENRIKKLQNMEI